MFVFIKNLYTLNHCHLLTLTDMYEHFGMPLESGLGYHTSSFFRTCPHFQGLNYRPGGIYKIKASVRKLGVFSFYSSS
jgi:hypothetical protein